MTQLFGRTRSREELLTHVGDIAQIGGIRRIRLYDRSTLPHLIQWKMMGAGTYVTDV